MVKLLHPTFFFLFFLHFSVFHFFFFFLAAANKQFIRYILVQFFSSFVPFLFQRGIFAPLKLRFFLRLSLLVVENYFLFQAFSTSSKAHYSISVRSFFFFLFSSRRWWVKFVVLSEYFMTVCVCVCVEWMSEWMWKCV